jgi:hypothetical protein
MGNSGSQEEKDAESVFNTKYISWDDNGNLRYGNPHRLCFFAGTLHQFETFSNKGLVHPVKRGAQLKEILKRDYVDDEVFVFPWVFSQ